MLKLVNECLITTKLRIIMQDVSRFMNTRGHHQPDYANWRAEASPVIHQSTRYCAFCGHVIPVNFSMLSVHLNFGLLLVRLPSLSIQSQTLSDQRLSGQRSTCLAHVHFIFLISSMTFLTLICSLTDSAISLSLKVTYALFLPSFAAPSYIEGEPFL